MPSRFASRLTSRISAGLAAIAERFQRRLPLPRPGETVVWWNTFTGDSHYYHVTGHLDTDPQAHDGMPWTIELFRDRQFYERKYCAQASAALDLQAAWKRMVKQLGLGRVYWVGSASMGRFDILVVERERQWRLLLYVKDRHVETRPFATEEQAVAAAHALETDLRSRPWFTWEPGRGQEP